MNHLILNKIVVIEKKEHKLFNDNKINKIAIYLYRLNKMITKKINLLEKILKHKLLNQ